MSNDNVGNSSGNPAENIKNFRKLEQATFNGIRKILPDHVILRICKEIEYEYRNRVISPIVTVLHMLLAAIWPEDSFNASWQVLWNAAVSKFTDLAGKSPSRNKVSEARKRLPRQLWEKLFTWISQRGQELSKNYACWKGHRVVLVDGTCVSMPDEPELRQEFGSNSGLHGPGKCDEEPLRHQTVDIPPIKPIVIEHVQHVRKCKKCGELVYAPLPDEVRRNVFGPGVLSIVGILTGMLNTSKRKALAVITEVFHVPMSLGGLSNCEARIADSIEKPCDDTVEHVRQQENAHADETGWPGGNREKGWLWVFSCTSAAVFMVHANRSQKAACKLIGSFVGKLVSDRYNAYNFYRFVRQICWAHLKRDFKAITEAHGKLGKIGLELHELAKQILKIRKRVRDGTLQWKTFQGRMPELQKRVESLLRVGAGFDGKLGGKCRDILKHKKHLWTFVEDQNVEPTNNFAEQLVRQGVLWRRTSFGTQSERGARYVERILAVCATSRLQDRSIIEYLRQACHCHLNGILVPSLVVNM